MTEEIDALRHAYDADATFTPHGYRGEAPASPEQGWFDTSPRRKLHEANLARTRPGWYLDPRRSFDSQVIDAIKRHGYADVLDEEESEDLTWTEWFFEVAAMPLLAVAFAALAAMVASASIWAVLRLWVGILSMIG